jgi:hypothetical protein
MLLLPKTMESTARRAGAALPGLQRLARSYRRANGSFHRLRTRYIAYQDSHPRLYISAQLVYAALFFGLLIATKTPPIIPLDLAFLLVFVALTGRPLEFIRDWSPFIGLLAAYEVLSDFGTQLAARANFSLGIDLDRALGLGRIPTNLLQQHLWNPSHFQWYDYATALLYAAHFGVPIFFGFVLWQWRRDFFYRFIVSYMLLSFAAYVTYILLPAAPPWMASDAGQIPHVSRILLIVVSKFAPVSTPGASAVSIDSVAAMPSLHAAFPLLVWLTAWRIWPRWGWTFVIYPLAVTFAIVYLGEHYLADALAGWLFAAAAFALVWAGFAEPIRRWAISQARVALRQLPRPRRAPSA